MRMLIVCANADGHAGARVEVVAQASPMKLKDSTHSMTAMAGKTTMCGESNRCERASFSIPPQLAAGGGSPKPRKLSVASARTAPAMPMAACTMMG